jgi:hypothetical protein
LQLSTPGRPSGDLTLWQKKWLGCMENCLDINHPLLEDNAATPLPIL